MYNNKNVMTLGECWRDKSYHFLRLEQRMKGRLRSLDGKCSSKDFVQKFCAIHSGHLLNSNEDVSSVYGLFETYIEAYLAGYSDGAKSRETKAKAEA